MLSSNLSRNEDSVMKAFYYYRFIHPNNCDVVEKDVFLYLHDRDFIKPIFKNTFFLGYSISELGLDYCIDNFSLKELIATLNLSPFNDKIIMD